MIGINIKMPMSCMECPFRQRHDGTCLFFENKKIPDIGKAEWCPLLRVEIAKRQAVYCETDLQLFGKDRIVDKFSDDSAVAIGRLMMNNEAILIVDETRDHFPDDNIPPEFRQNHVLTALAFIVIPGAVKLNGKIVNEGSRKS